MREDKKGRREGRWDENERGGWVGGRMGGKIGREGERKDGRGGRDTYSS